MRRTLLAGPRLADDLLERFFDPSTPSAPTRRLEMRESDDEYGVRLELPGFTPEEVSVELTRDVLTIRAETAASAGSAGAEGSAGASWPRAAERLSRAVRFEKPIDAARVEAQLSHGVLLVRLPKSDEARPRKIAVRAAGEAVLSVTPSLEHRPESTTTTA